MTIKVLVLPVRGQFEIQEIDPNSVTDLQKLVGGYFEMVRVPRVPKLLIWVDEEAASKDPQPSINLRGSLLAGRALLGTVVVSGATNDNIGSIPAGLLERILENE